MGPIRRRLSIVLPVHVRCLSSTTGGSKDPPSDGNDNNNKSTQGGSNNKHTSTSGGDKGGDKKSGQWWCPKCGDPCTNVETCACMYITLYILSISYWDFFLLVYFKM